MVIGAARWIGIGSMLVVLEVPPGAGAQAPSATAKTITALGTGTVHVAKPRAQTNAAIGRVVSAARQAAGPVAVRAAGQEAQRLAQAAGLTLGALVSIAEQPASPYGPFFGYGVEGTFGPGRFCGTIRVPIFRRDAQGHRHLTHRFRKRHRCRYPHEISMTLSATYAAT
jgi:Protein of unknown function (DUF541)